MALIGHCDHVMKIRTREDNMWFQNIEELKMGRLRPRYEVRIDPLFSGKGFANLVVSKLACNQEVEF